MDIVAYWQKNCAPYLRALFGRSERGAALVEYALLLALIAVVCIVALTTLGKQASSKFSQRRQLDRGAELSPTPSPRSTAEEGASPRLAPSSRPARSAPGPRSEFNAE